MNQTCEQMNNEPMMIEQTAEVAYANPPIPPQPQYDTEKRRVSMDNCTIDDTCSNNNSAEQQQETTPTAAHGRANHISLQVQCLNHARNNNGKFLSKLHKKKIFLFLCELGHKFFLTKKEVLDGVWCNTCRKTFCNLKRFARENRGHLLNERIEKTVEFRCEAGHTWETTCRKAFWHWCKICSKNTKQILKDLNRQENVRLEQEKMRKQAS